MIELGKAILQSHFNDIESFRSVRKNIELFLFQDVTQEYYTPIEWKELRRKEILDNIRTDLSRAMYSYHDKPDGVA